MREICLARLDKARPVLVLTRDTARAVMTKVAVAPITSTVKGLSSEVPVGRENGLDHNSAVSIDNVLTIPADLLGRTLGFLALHNAGCSRGLNPPASRSARAM